MADRSSAGSALRFLLVGGTTVLIDAATYTVLNLVGVDYDIAKTISFVTGAGFAYFANWRFTFGSRRSRWSEVRFVLIYLAALGINIALNGLIRGIDPASPIAAAMAFLVATGVSAVWNFIGMSLFVFQRSSPAASAPIGSRTTDASTSAVPPVRQ